MTERAQLARLDGSPMRVLIVEDEDTLSQLLSMAFKYEGWDVRTAADGQRRSGRRASTAPTSPCWM